MRRSALQFLLAAGLVVSVTAAALAQNAPPPQPALSYQGGFIERFFNAYVDEFNQPSPAVAGQTAEAPSGRRPPPFPSAPLESPPWPWTDWPFGGTLLLGGATPNSSGNNLMKALGDTPAGDFLKENNVEIWGWLNAGANLSTSKGKDSNLPAGTTTTRTRSCSNRR